MKLLHGRCRGVQPDRRRWALGAVAATALLLTSLSGCGGGGGSTDAPAAAAPPLAPLGAGESAYDDPAAYSSAGGASLAGAVEAAAVTRHSVTVGGAPAT